MISSDKRLMIHSIFIRRYNQSTREGVKSTNDGQQSVPLCSTSDVQLRFLCPDDLEEVNSLMVVTSVGVFRSKIYAKKYFPGSNIVSRLVSD